jgi:hypothetical protein
VIVKTVRRVAGSFISLGKTGYRLRGGDTKVVKGKIAAADRRKLRHARRVKIRVVVSNSNPDIGAITSATKLATVTTRGL